MTKHRINTQTPVSPRESRDPKPAMNEEMASLIQAFEFFASNTERLRDSYDKLQEQISSLDLELTRKNEELDLNLREMDSVKHHLENILESMNMGVIVINLDGNVSVFNRTATELTGYSRQSVVGKAYADTIGKSVPEEYTPLFTLHKGIERRNQEKVITTKKGKEIPVEFSTSMVSSENGEILGVVELFSDLREIKKLQEEVQHSRTLAALGEMAGNVAHELRNPLGGIGGFAALLERDLGVDDPRRKLVQKIIEGVSRLNSIATNLLVYTRPVRSKMRPENIVQIVEDVVSLVQVELEQDESDVTVKKEYSIDSFDVCVDPELFQQVLLNIFKNAVQAMSYKGEIIVGLKPVKENKEIEIFVHDSGPGITGEDRQKLFLPFYTTKADGTGLGLSIAKKIVEAHNGSITIDSGKKKGTTFRINLPC